MSDNFSESQRICDAATAGPWDFGVFEDGRHVIHDNTYFSRHIAEIVSGGVESEQREEDNATFIAEARTGWPAALERIHAQDAEIERLTFERDIAVGGFHEQSGLAGELIDKNTRLRMALSGIIQVSKWDGIAHELDRCYVIAREALHGTR